MSVNEQMQLARGLWRQGPAARLRRAALCCAMVGCAFAMAACARPAATRYQRKQAQAALTKLEQPGLVLGEFALASVVDGDTIKVSGLDASLRLLGIDAEETFKSAADRRAYEAGWQSYLQAKRGSSKRPVKMATPLGEAAKVWAKNFFDGVTTVRLERDHPAEIRDRYNRYLAYVLVKRNGTWVNFNVEAVRAGMSPYFAKYGQSRRFHAEFVAAQAEARAAQRGIWQPGVQAYPDYDERLAWWTPRGEFVAGFRAAGEGKPEYVDITHWDALERLERMVGQPVVVLGTVGEVKLADKGPARVTLSRRMGGDFPLIFFDRDLLGVSGLAQWRGEFVVVRGVPTIYENIHTHRKQVQIVVEQASQIELSAVPGLVKPSVPDFAAGADEGDD